MSQQKKKMLLHVCCAPCSSYVLKIVSRDFTPTVFFYNPNIQPFEEYLKRRLDAEGYVRSLGLHFVEGEYDTERWNRMVEGLGDEPEGGVRCEICIKMRMNQVALYAVQNGFKAFATTLTVSPHKNSVMINRICHELAQDYGLDFYKADFKKNNGYQISCQMARELDFYRQDYCGCLISLRQTYERRQMREEKLSTIVVRDRMSSLIEEVK